MDKASLIKTIKRFAPYVLLLLSPVVFNLILWKAFLSPQQAELARLEELHALLELRPKLENLIAAEQQLVSDWKSRDVIQNDPAATIKFVQKAAQDELIQIKKMDIGEMSNVDGLQQAARQSAGNLKMVPISLEVDGGFHKIGRWLAAIEDRSDIRIEGWDLKYAGTQGAENKLNLRLIVIVRQ